MWKSKTALQMADHARIGAKDKSQFLVNRRNGLFELGLIIERCGPRDEVVKCMMPLTTSYAELDEGLDILERAFEAEFNRDTRDEKVHDIARGVPA